MTTALQKVVRSSITKRQANSLDALQNKVENNRGFTMRVSDAQMRALQAAYDAAKASGIALDPTMVATAAALGLK